MGHCSLQLPSAWPRAADSQWQVGCSAQAVVLLRRTASWTFSSMRALFVAQLCAPVAMTAVALTRCASIIVAWHLACHKSLNAWVSHSFSSSSGVLAGIAADRAGYVDQALFALKDSLPAGAGRDFVASLAAGPPAVALSVAPLVDTAVVAVATRAPAAAEKATEKRSDSDSSLGTNLVVGVVVAALAGVAYKHRRALAKLLAEVRPHA